MKKKIVKIYQALLPKRKERVKIDIALHFEKNTETVKNHWLLAGNTPDAYADEVLQIMERALTEQTNEHETLLEPSTAKPI